MTQPTTAAPTARDVITEALAQYRNDCWEGRRRYPTEADAVVAAVRAMTPVQCAELRTNDPQDDR
jgi:hypothetical protein